LAVLGAAGEALKGVGAAPVVGDAVASPACALGEPGNWRQAP